VGFRYYKRVNLGGGLKLNLSKTGAGVSAGVPGLRYSVHSSGRTVKTAGIPGTGIYYRKDTYAKGPRSRSSGTRARPVAPAVAMYPKAGLFAPKEEKEFVKGVTAYMQGRPGDALAHLQASSARDTAQRHIAEEFFEGLSYAALNKLDEAQLPFEDTLASDQEIPDALMMKYGVGGMIQVQVTPFVLAELPMSHVGAALLLSEVYQATGQAERAVELLESLGSVAAEPIFALGLAELYDAQELFDEVLRVTEGFTENQDDGTAQLLVFRANALAEKGLKDAALATLKEALRFPSRSPLILRLARYVRASVYERMGRKAQARKDLERIYAEDPSLGDVGKRLGVESSHEVKSPTSKGAG
jgi:tetratricopeptide (TPR) repeat protein